MCHLARGLKWDPVCVASVLSRSGVAASVDGNTVRIELGEIAPKSRLGRLLRCVNPPRPLVITIKHDPTQFIRNIELTYYSAKFPFDHPHRRCIEAALEECGCAFKSDREIADFYCPNSDELLALLKTVESLQQEKEDLIDAHDFEAAILKRDEQLNIRKQIDAYLFRMVS